MSVEELKSLQSNIIRKNKMCNLIGTMIIGIVMCISVFVVLKRNMEYYYSVIILFVELIFLIIILTLIKNKVNGKNIEIFNKGFKSIFVLNSLRQFFENLNYNSEKGFSEEYIKNVGILDMGDKFDSNDYVSGTYKNIKFEQSDICIEERHEEEDDEGNKEVTWETIFKGRLMIFDFNKNFKANVQILSYNFAANILPGNKKLSKIEMEDIEFNNMFTIYSESDHDAFYILTPHLMQKIKNIKKELKCNMMFNFLNNRLYIAIDNDEDSFEYYVFKPINEQEIEANIVKDIRLITNFVDELNLDNDLFR